MELREIDLPKNATLYQNTEDNSLLVVMKYDKYVERQKFLKERKEAKEPKERKEMMGHIPFNGARPRALVGMAPDLLAIVFNKVMDTNVRCLNMAARLKEFKDAGYEFTDNDLRKIHKYFGIKKTRGKVIRVKESDIPAIKAAVDSGLTRVEVGQKFGISDSMVDRIYHGTVAESAIIRDLPVNDTAEVVEASPLSNSSPC